MSEVTVDTKGLDKLVAMFSKVPVVSVGVLGQKNARSKTKGSNATIGMKHEFGMDGLPVRSWLRMPLLEKLPHYLETAGAFSEDVIVSAMAERSLMGWMKKVAIVAETVIQDAFNTGGFGKWKPSNMRFKRNKQTLVETKQLRESITSEVRG